MSLVGLCLGTQTILEFNVYSSNGIYKFISETRSVLLNVPNSLLLSMNISLVLHLCKIFVVLIFHLSFIITSHFNKNAVVCMVIRWSYFFSL